MIIICTNIPSALFPKTNPTPIKGYAMAFTFLPACTHALADESKWLEEVQLTANYDDNAYVTWSVHHAAQRRGLTFHKCLVSIA
jgi:hypothetical protein